MKTILVFGDSNVWGHYPEIGNEQNRLPYEQRLCGLLQAQLGDRYRIIEDGLGGRMARMEDPLTPNRCGYPHLEIALEMHAPVDLLALHLGTNEARDMFNMNARTIACSLERLVNLAMRHPAGHSARRVLIIAPHPLAPDVKEKHFGYIFGDHAFRATSGFSAAFRELADRCSCDFLDCAPLGFELNPFDGVHYCANDLKKLAAAIAGFINAENI